MSDAAGNSATQVTRTVTITADVTVPVVTLVGDATVSLELGSTYTDAGATATDNIDGTITSSIVTVNPVNVNAVGTYTVTYNVDDAAGNAATQVTRTVNDHCRCHSSGHHTRWRCHCQPGVRIFLY